MTADQRRPISMELLVLLAVTVVVASLPACIRIAGPNVTFVGLVSAILVHVVHGTVIWSRIEYEPRWHAPYLTVQTALALLIIWLGSGYGSIGIITIPLAAQAGILLERRGAIAFAVLLTVLDGVVARAMGIPWGSMLAYSASAGTGIFFGVLFAQVVRSASRSREEVERLNEELTAANEKLRELAAKSAALATAEERNRIAREIHDSVGHALTTLSVQLDAAQQVVSLDPERARDLLAKAHAVAGQGLDEVRRAVAAMRSDPHPGQLHTAIGDLADKARQTGLRVDLAVTGHAPSLPPEAHQTVYRAAQEALTNVRKHGREGRASMDLRFTPQVVQLRVTNPVAAENGAGGGFGLVGLRERAERLSGRLDAATCDGDFVFDLEIPVAS